MEALNLDNCGCSAAHQDTVGNIYFQLRSKKTTNCVVRVAPFDIKIILNNDTSVVQPDLIVICENATLPCAVFEVLSPSTAAKDKGIKKDLYQLSKIKEYYIINTDLKIIDKYILDHDKYYYVKGYSLDEAIKIECIDVEILVQDIFENID